MPSLAPSDSGLLSWFRGGQTFARKDFYNLWGSEGSDNFLSVDALGLGDYGKHGAEARAPGAVGDGLEALDNEIESNGADAIVYHSALPEEAGVIMTSPRASSMPERMSTSTLILKSPTTMARGRTNVDSRHKQIHDPYQSKPVFGHSSPPMKAVQKHRSI